MTLSELQIKAANELKNKEWLMPNVQHGLSALTWVIAQINHAYRIGFELGEKNGARSVKEGIAKQKALLIHKREEKKRAKALRKKIRTLDNIS